MGAGGGVEEWMQVRRGDQRVRSRTTCLVQSCTAALHKNNHLALFGIWGLILDITIPSHRHLQKMSLKAHPCVLIAFPSVDLSTNFRA